MEPTKPLIAYVGPFGFPDGGAAARRILGNAQSMVAAGYRVSIGSGQCTPAHGNGSSSIQDGITVDSIGERTSEHLSSPLKRMRYALMGRRTVAWLDRMSQKPAAVVLYSGYSPYLLNLMPWCRKHAVPLVFDAVEWYEPVSTFAGLVSPYQWNIDFAMRFLCTRIDGIIAISSYLQDFYEAAGRRVARVPPTLDTAVIEARTAGSSNGLTICYAGSPGNKDLLDTMIEAVLRIDTSGQQVRFHIAGLGEEDVLKYPALATRGLHRLPGSVVAFGQLPHDRTLSLVRESDFSVLLRRDSRYAHAGFPTKFVESFAVGTPVIANLTSDLKSHLRDGNTGFVCDGEDAEQMERALRRALAADANERGQIRVNARRHAELAFDYRVFSDMLGSFLRDVRAA